MNGKARHDAEEALGAANVKYGRSGCSDGSNPRRGYKRGTRGAVPLKVTLGFNEANRVRPTSANERFDRGFTDFSI